MQVNILPVLDTHQAIRLTLNVWLRDRRDACSAVGRSSFTSSLAVLRSCDLAVRYTFVHRLLLSRLEKHIHTATGKLSDWHS